MMILMSSPSKRAFLARITFINCNQFFLFLFLCALMKHVALIIRGPKSRPSASMLHASRPEATSLDYIVRPQSKIDPDEIRARAYQVELLYGFVCTVV